jgi:hypothetical protein
MESRLAPIGLAGLVTAVLAACGGGPGGSACRNEDGALSATAFVFVEAPRSGERVSSGFRVAGCSSTFEGNVTCYSIRARQVGLLEVVEPTVTREGFPPVRNVVPLVLRP